jgi:hypothetical protein
MPYTVNMQKTLSFAVWQAASTHIHAHGTETARHKHENSQCCGGPTPQGQKPLYAAVPGYLLVTVGDSPLMECDAPHPLGVSAVSAFVSPFCLLACPLASVTNGSAADQLLLRAAALLLLLLLLVCDNVCCLPCMKLEVSCAAIFKVVAHRMHVMQPRTGNTRRSQLLYYYAFV